VRGFFLGCWEEGRCVLGRVLEKPEWRTTAKSSWDPGVARLPRVPLVSVTYRGQPGRLLVPPIHHRAFEHDVNRTRAAMFGDARGEAQHLLMLT